MKVTVVAAVLNNEATVSKLLDSLLGQTRQPDEIIIVDGGSSDNTISILKDYENTHPNLIAFSRPMNKAESRNFGINAASHKIIAQIDGSCVASPDWLEKLVKPLRKRNVDVAAGFYKIVNKNAIARAVSPFIGVTSKKFDHRTYMPTGRSMALRKSVWKKMGGYSEDLQWSGEDNLFNYKLLLKKVNIVRVPDAVVYWHSPSTFRQAAKKIFSYTAGISQTGTWRHPCESLATVNVNVFAVYFRWLLGLTVFFAAIMMNFLFVVFILGFSIYVFYSIWHKQAEVEDQRSIMLIPVIQLLVDMSVMAGFVSGLLSLRKKRSTSDVEYSRWAIFENQHTVSHGSERFAYPQEH